MIVVEGQDVTTLGQSGQLLPIPLLSLVPSLEESCLSLLMTLFVIFTPLSLDQPTQTTCKYIQTWSHDSVCIPTCNLLLVSD